MKRNSIFFILFVAITALGTLSAQVVSLQDGKSQKQEIKIIPTDNMFRSMSIESTISYDMISRELTMVLKPKIGYYDAILIPMHRYNQVTLNRNTRNGLGGKYAETKQMKKMMAFGLEPAFVCDNCEFFEANNFGISQEMYNRSSNEQTYHFKVKDPQNPVSIKIRNVVPVKTQVTAMGKMKYIYQFIAEDVELKITVPNNPCILPENKSLINEVGSLYEELKRENETLRNLNGMRKTKECKECKERLMNEYVKRLEQLMNRHYSAVMTCPDVQALLDESKTIIDSAKVVACKGLKIHPYPPDENRESIVKSAKKIKEAGNALQDYIDAIRNNHNVETVKSSGRQLIVDIDNYIDGLSPNAIKDANLKETIEFYMTSKKTFEKVANRK